MQKSKKNVVFCVLFLLSGCTYQATTAVTPAYNVYSNYEDKIPGRFALYVDGHGLRKEAVLLGNFCGAHSFPIDAQTNFSDSVKKTIANIVQDVQSIPSLMDMSAAEAAGFDRILVVRVEEFSVRLSFIEGFWSATGNATADISIGVTAEGKKGHLLGTKVNASATETGQVGGCEGGAQAIKFATEKAIRKGLERLGERISNSRRLRDPES